MLKELTQNLSELNSRAHDVLKLIEAHDQIVILRHQKPDPDAYGAQLGLRNYLRNKYEKKEVFAFGATEPSLSFLGDMDEEKSLDEPLVIAVDTANIDRLDGTLEHAKHTVKIDHHPDVEQFGDVSIVETSVSSASELLYLLMDIWDKAPLDEEAAACLYMGIVGDTGRFLYNNTSPLTLQVASQLIDYDFDAAKLNTEMHKSSKKAFMYKGWLISQAVFLDSGIAYTYVTEDVIKEFDLSISEAGLDVNIFRDIEEVKVWFLALEDKDQIRIRLRSKEIVINDIAALFGGGGHPLASGVRVKDKDELQALIEKIEEKLV